MVNEQHVTHDESAAWNKLVSTVLALVIETCPSDQLDTKALCSLLQVSAACMQALQGSRGQHRVSITACVAAMSGFKAWLPKWAGLVAEVHLQPTKTYIWERRQEEAWSKLFTALQQCADSNSASTAAGAAPAAMRLLLTGFSSDVSLSKEVLDGLPLVPPSLTRLELGSVSLWADGLPAALQRLSNLAHLKLERDCSPKQFTHVTALQQLSKLATLEILPMFSGDTKTLPTSLVMLNLCFEAGVRMEPSPSDSEGGDAAVGRWWSEEDSEPNDEDWPHDPPLGDAARQLDLSHLPMLQCCRLQQLAQIDKGLRFGLNYRSDIITVHLATPQLTRLALFGGFRDVLGQQDSTSLQQLWLMGCVVGAPRLAELLAATPALLGFSWLGSEGALYGADADDTRSKFPHVPGPAAPAGCRSGLCNSAHCAVY